MVLQFDTHFQRNPAQSEKTEWLLLTFTCKNAIADLYLKNANYLCLSMFIMFRFSSKMQVKAVLKSA